MPNIITGVVTNAVVIPSAPLPEGAEVEIQVKNSSSKPIVPPPLTPRELRKPPREQRQAVLAAAADMAEEDYRTDKDLTGFDAF